MSAIAHTFVEVNSEFTTASNVYVDVTGAVISSGSFTVGKKYLLVITAQVVEDAGGYFFMQPRHGSTDFAESGQYFAPAGSGSGVNFRYTYGWFTVWTAVSGEAIQLRMGVTSGNAIVNKVGMLAICLSDDVVENTDWFFAEATADASLSTTPSDGASITFTPSGASDWLVLSLARIDYSATSVIVTSKMVRSGEASSSTPAEVLDASATDQEDTRFLARVFACTAASNTFKEQSVSGSSSSTRVYSSIFALNLNKFAAHGFTYTDGGQALGTASDFVTNIQSASITPAVTGNVWMLSYFTCDVGDANERSTQRLQVDGSDQPAGQTTDAYKFDVGHSLLSTNDKAMVLSTVASLSNASHTLTLDSSTNSSTGTPTAKQRLIMAVSMELASGAPPPSFVKLEIRAAP